MKNLKPLSSSKLDAVIVGGGVVGLSAAYWLSSSRKKVAVLDQSEVPNFKAPSGDHMRAFYLTHGKDSFYTELARAALSFWLKLNAESGQTIFSQIGFLDLAEKVPGFASYSFETLKKMKIRAEWIEKKDLPREHGVFNAKALKGALFHPDGGFIWAQRALSLIAALAQKEGAVIHGRTQVKNLIKDKSGKLKGVKDSSGKIWEAENFIFTTGIWSSQILKDYRIPLRPSRQFQIYLKPPQNPGRFRLEHFTVFRLASSGFCGFPMHLHGYMKLIDYKPGSLGDPNEDKLKTPPPAVEKKCRAFLKKYVPDLASYSESETSLCHFDVTKDGDFIVDKLRKFPNAYIAAGFNGKGFSLAPSIGKILSDWIVAGKPSVNLQRFRLSRFK